LQTRKILFEQLDVTAEHVADPFESYKFPFVSLGLEQRRRNNRTEGGAQRQQHGEYHDSNPGELFNEVSVGNIPP
jgi:hypothetical protein